MTQRILRYLAGLTGLLFLVLGLMLLLAPGRMTGQFAVFPAGSAGFSTLRGDLGGLFLGMALFAFLGAIGAADRWLTVPAVFLLFIVLGRIVNLLLDGYSRESAQLLVLELVLITIFVLLIVSARRSPSRGLGLAIVLPVVLLLVLGAAFIFQRQIGMMLTKAYVERSFHNQLLPTLQDGLHAGLCGSGTPMPDPTRAGPCVVVIAGKHVYVVDVGEGSPRKLALMGVAPTDPVPVIGPQGVESVVNGFNAAYALDKTYRIAHHGEATMPPSGQGGVARPFTLVAGSDASQVVLQQDGLTITAFAVRHAPVFPAAGYRFDYGGRSIVISGDTAPSPVLAKYSQDVDVLFHEGLQAAMVSVLHDAAVRNNRPGVAKIAADIPSYHTTPEDAARIAQQAGVRQLVFYHTFPPLPFAYLNAAFLGDAPKIFHGPITVGKDGLLVSLPAGGTSIAMRELL